MGSHVTHGACPVIPQAAPYKMTYFRIVRFFGCRAQPHIPVKVLRDFNTLRTFNITLWPVTYRAIGPHIYLPYGTYNAGANPFHNPSCSFRGMSLVTHLRDNI